MPQISRSYYDAPTADFLGHSSDEILGRLAKANQFSLEETQRAAWLAQINLLRSSIPPGTSHIVFEFSIPRMGKRADVVLLTNSLVIVLEFKVGEESYPKSALQQTLDYALDLKNFHAGSYARPIAPILVSTDAPEVNNSFDVYRDDILVPLQANRTSLSSVLANLAHRYDGVPIMANDWIHSLYKPTPTIIEAAQALYRGHDVKVISRSDAGAQNLTETAKEISQIIEFSKSRSHKSICFITGVPGAGKTLAGLNLANSWHDPENDEHAVFLSGNGPLVYVLREALARDEVVTAKNKDSKLTKSAALSKVKSFVQNVHHFRDDVLSTYAAPAERVVIFDEAQRAWNQHMTSKFMKTKKGISNFDKSEPEFLISALDRHKNWATIICLIGGGQEINTGEGGLAEWLRALKRSFPDWNVYASDRLQDSEYTSDDAMDLLRSLPNFQFSENLHLAVSVRSFRAEKVSALVKAILDIDVPSAQALAKSVLPKYPIYITRDIDTARYWIRDTARGSERYGLIASSEARRLKPYAINVKATIDPADWFLNDSDDVRSSYFLEDVATEFQVQGLEIDWACVAWDADLRFSQGTLSYNAFRGSNWNTIHKKDRQEYLLNAYRVLLTRARQEMVLFVPVGDDRDSTRPKAYYDETYAYLKSIGLPVLTEASNTMLDM